MFHITAKQSRTKTIRKGRPRDAESMGGKKMENVSASQKMDGQNRGNREITHLECGA